MDHMLCYCLESNLVSVEQKYETSLICCFGIFCGFFFFPLINIHLNYVTVNYFKIHYLTIVRNSIVDSFLEFAGLKTLVYYQTLSEIHLVKGKDYTEVLTVK